MNTSMLLFRQQKRNLDMLRQKLRWSVSHGVNLPENVNLRPYMTEIEDQGDMGSCVANAIAGSLEYLYKRYARLKLDVSRLFIDFNARIANLDWRNQQQFVIDINNPRNSFGTQREAGLRALQQYGFCKESLWPYDRSLYLRPPPLSVYKEAARRSIIPLKIPINVDSVRTCLAHQIPVLVGILLSSNDAYHNQGWIKIPTKPPVDEGYHACLVVGYDDSTEHFIIRNSWGAQWGDKGYCYVPYQYLVDRRLVAPESTFWAVAQIIPRKMMRRGYLSYPNFTQYHWESATDQAFYQFCFRRQLFTQRIYTNR
ncbi:unnamed protein product [Adineta ricciae]|uniref:Peptidase C1A papain C-terminal domain-containing protein n=2 Tax=Adineta ricciae TaxID=249248 RepID=A0A815ZHV9_ADIRI|nr:unnamed protein product [Adineta ricciae]CAF1585359.1 unnamed protein product [Adineta ricciae]